jgi:hypothetical protein
MAVTLSVVGPGVEVVSPPRSDKPNSLWSAARPETNAASQDARVARENDAANR